jgi:hypothetical protein
MDVGSGSLTERTALVIISQRRKRQLDSLGHFFV